MRAFGLIVDLGLYLLFLLGFALLVAISYWEGGLGVEPVRSIGSYLGSVRAEGPSRVLGFRV